MNNIFEYATKELSQDAFLCWSINWITEGENHPLYKYGKEILDLFLGNEKLEKYNNVKVYTQYAHIDILVLFKDIKGDSHALIIEDKTNTSEHKNQMLRYKEKIAQNISSDYNLKEYKNPQIHLVYIKTGIMYDVDIRMTGKGAVVIDIDALLKVVSRYAALNESEILSNFHSYIQNIKNKRIAIEEQIQNGEYEVALKDYYGQFYFIDKIFNDRSKGIALGLRYTEHKNNYNVFIDEIYAGANNSGTPFTQYCFWGDKYPKNYNDKKENEYHYMFWRIDYSKERNNDIYEPYIALRHYDEYAHSKIDCMNIRKKSVYEKLRKYADGNYNDKYPDIFKKIGERGNYKESDLIFINIRNIKHMNLDEIRNLLREITNSFKETFKDPQSSLYYDIKQ